MDLIRLSETEGFGFGGLMPFKITGTGYSFRFDGEGVWPSKSVVVCLDDNHWYR